MAVRAVANAARYANWIVGVRKPYVETVSINKELCVPHFATQSDRVPARGGLETPAILDDVARKTKVAYAIWCFGELAKNPPGGLKRAVNIP